MNTQPEPRRSRRTAALLGSALVLAIAAVAGAAVLTSGAAPATTPVAISRSVPPSASAAPVATAAPSSTPTPTPTATPTPTSAPTRAAVRPAPAPQPTRTAAIASAAPIVRELTAKVQRMEAVQGVAVGPGEIAGPSVRFTIAITNTTGAAVDLASTVVNAYSGADAAPAVQLQAPGARPFPTSVANGATVPGVFVFNIAPASRDHVVVTVDTSVRNPVVAFKGAAPR